MALFVTYSNEMDRTIKIFDEFYATDLIVSSNDYDVVRGYFLNVCDTTSIADNFTALFFRIAQEAGINPIELLEIIKTGPNDKLSLDKVFCYYLNTFKSKASLYGVAVLPKPIQPVARNVVL
jgi:hypothetical protein